MTDVQALTLFLVVLAAISVFSAIVALHASARSRRSEDRINRAIVRNATRRAHDEHLQQPNGARR